MTIEAITTGLQKLLEESNYNLATLKFYQREWRKISSFLLDNYDDTEYDMERGLAYLERQYDFQTKYNDGTLSQQSVQLLRVVHMIEDYRLHKVLTRRYHASKNPIQLKGQYAELLETYIENLTGTDLSRNTIDHYTTTSRVFLDYLFQQGSDPTAGITVDVCNGYLKTLAGFAFKTVEQNVCGLRHFLRFLQDAGTINEDITTEIHMPAISKTAGIPSAWTAEELRGMIHAIDRSNPLGKRDYAMILLASILGIRIGDIKALKFSNFHWEEKQLSFVQHKTHKPITLPIPDAVGWAVIDYIKNGRPKYYDTDTVFVKHMPPFDPLSESDHLERQIVKYMNKAGIHKDRNRHCGFHSLRHSAGSMFLEMGTPLPVITTILGHTDMDVTGIYLKTDLEKLAECILSPDPESHG